MLITRLAYSILFIYLFIFLGTQSWHPPSRVATLGRDGIIARIGFLHKFLLSYWSPILGSLEWERKKKQGGVCPCIFKAKEEEEELWKLKYFTMQKYNLQKIPNNNFFF
jgi:hypothetical protein